MAQALAAGVSESLIRCSVSYVAPVAAASYLQLAVGVQVIESKSSASTSQATLKATYVIPAAALKYVSLALSVVLDPIGRNPFLRDVSVVADEARIGFTKTTQDSVGKSDFTLVAFVKGLTSTAATSESQLQFDVGRALEDRGIISDPVGLGVQKPQSDSLTFSDLTSVGTGKRFTDRTSYPQDGPNYYQTYATGYFAEDYVFEGFPAILFGKGLTESKTASDVISAKAFAKQLSDYAVSTDDFFGAANADDDETMSFAKVASESLSRTDAATLTANKAVADAISKSDVKNLAVEKALSDAATSSETTGKGVSKSFSEVVAKTDSQSILLGKAAAEAVAISEASAKDLAKARTDAVASSEASVKGIGKAATDSASTGESKSFAISKALADQVISTDDFQGTANADDDETMVFGKSVTEALTKSDVSTKLAAKAASDAAATSESGSIVWTDYWDINYTVTTSGIYVGNTQSF